MGFFKHFSSSSKLNHHLTEWILLIALTGLVIFAWLPNSYFQMVGLPWSIVWQISFLAISSWLIYALRRFNCPFYRLGHGLDWGLLALTLAMIVSASFSAFPSLAAQNVVLFLDYVMLLYALCNMSLPWFTNQFLVTSLVFIGWISSIVGLLKWRPTRDMWLSENFYAAIRNAFPLGHHNFSGGYFVLILPLAVGIAFIYQGWQRWWGILASISIAAALYVSGSRGALLGIVAATSLSLGILLWQSKGTRRRRAILFTAIMLSLMTGLVFSNPRMRTLISFPAQSSDEVTASVVIRDGPARDRYFMAVAASNILRHRPFTGVGPGNMTRVYNLYRPIEAGTGLDQTQQLHNTPLQILGELGIIGFSAYIWLMGCCIKLWWKTLKQSTDKNYDNHILLYAVGISFFGYAVSSFTDYQLENIPISFTLVALLYGLLSFYQKPLISEQKSLGQKNRRIASLAVLLFLSITPQFWVRNDLSLWLTKRALNSLEASDFVRADQLLNKATLITPWDPTASALMAQEISNAQTKQPSMEQAKLLKELAIDYYKTAVGTAPNDVWFNRNLAVLYMPEEPEKAESYASRAVQLLPRTPDFSYYLLGLTYLEQNKLPQAVSAFTLQLLTEPKFSLMTLWEQPTWQSMKSTVLQKTFSLYDQLLTQVPSNSATYDTLYEELQIMQWWLGNSPDIINNIQKLRPITQALLNVEKNPKQTLKNLDVCLLETRNNKACLLLRAWIQPENYLADYFENTEFNTTEEDEIQRSIEQHRNIKTWLKTETIKPEQRARNVVSFAYRTIYANDIRLILPAPGLFYSGLSEVLHIFPKRPSREIPELDWIMETIRTEELGLPHATYNNFNL